MITWNPDSIKTAYRTPLRYRMVKFLENELNTLEIEVELRRGELNQSLPRAVAGAFADHTADLVARMICGVVGHYPIETKKIGAYTIEECIRCRRTTWERKVPINGPK